MEYTTSFYVYIFKTLFFNEVALGQLQYPLIDITLQLRAVTVHILGAIENPAFCTTFSIALIEIES